MKCASAPLLRELTRPWAPPRGARVLVAVSGGADSVALVRLVAALAPGRGWSVVLASLDHGLRGAEGADDLAFVRTLAGELGCPVVAARRPVERARGESPEEAARRVRLGFLREAARDHGCAAIALGHTEDDQAETVLDRLARGCGLAGASAMRRWSDGLWRPLLDVPRADLRVFLAAVGAGWREDASNASPDFLRNRIRAELLPVLERVAGPGAVRALARAAALAADDDAALRALAEERVSAVLLRETGDTVELDRRALTDLPPAVSRRILRRCCDRLAGRGGALNARHAAALLELAGARGPGTRADLPHGLAAERKGRLLILSAGRNDTP